MGNLDDIAELFYRGLRNCCKINGMKYKSEHCHTCKIAPLDVRKEVQRSLMLDLNYRLYTERFESF